MIPTSVDLCPSWPGNQARVSLAPLTTGQWRCCIWGADDMGFDFDTPSYDTARKQYDALTELKEDPVTAKWPGWVRA